MTTTTHLEVIPGHGLGMLVLGDTLHEVLGYLKSRPQVFQSIDLSYSSTVPIQSPVIVELPLNGLRLRFDGVCQRLRLIEVLDFSKSRFSYRETDVVKASSDVDSAPKESGTDASGPTFRHIYHKLFGPTFPGEYIQPAKDHTCSHGTYVLSYPGIAFSFRLKHASWSPKADFVSLLSSEGASKARSMAIFQGSSWPETRRDLFTAPAPNRNLNASKSARDLPQDDVDTVSIHGSGRMKILFRSGQSVPLLLSETTPQDLVAELGPPDAIYQKNDRRLAIHQPHSPGLSSPRAGPQDRSDACESALDTDHSSNQSATEESSDGPDSADSDDPQDSKFEYFYNYFRYGFDVLISRPTSTSPLPLNSSNHSSTPRVRPASSDLVVIKILLHGNVPGSYSFNRHRRIRWKIEYDGLRTRPRVDSDMLFSDMSNQLKVLWKGSYATPEEEINLQQGMVLSRGWGDSPSSSCELLGGMDDSPQGEVKRNLAGSELDDLVLGNTQLYGFPGLIFEVLKNDVVSCVTVY